MPNLTRILAGVLIALALLLGIFAWTLSRRPVVHPVMPVAQATFPVVVAARVLPAGKPISVDALRVQSLPINPNGAFVDPSMLAGRVPTSDIGADSPVLEAQLSSGIAERIEPGERAVAVRVDESNAVGNRLRPGNFVDVFFTLKREGNGASGAEVERSQARLLMSKVRVLAFGNATPGADNPGDANGMVRTAVLAVPVADVDNLTLAETSGRLVLALRNPKDAEVVDPAAFAATDGVLKIAANAPAGDATQDSTRAAAGVALDQLSGSAGNTAARPQVAPRAVRPTVRVAAAPNENIEVIRGGRAETVAR
ncbi:Flp pilus assembly protein CpaB [Paraburkholderia phenazinium]|jgi:pilus assembly protein CpaB|uniref:Pilus assembly protein CpaB n=1 Tax=Paraburkholderia phenazinium TaxID=60549 RepID=A0A1G8EKZ7_9BURK|nr:Flp pilus assembly protein CpaB [Paraburkholderia phenazinium]SDH70588.1 pilus assembly protein CpaB [Paraburkholderia phenazinium]